MTSKNQMIKYLQKLSIHQLDDIGKKYKIPKNIPKQMKIEYIMRSLEKDDANMNTRSNLPYDGNIENAYQVGDRNAVLQILNYYQQNLPYNGDIQSAMRNTDRDAIRQILQYNQMREQYGGPMREPSQDSILPQFQDCSNPISYITQDKFTENYPANVRIYVYENQNSNPQVLCYNKQEIQQWMNDIFNYFNNWVQNPNSQPMDDTGMGGKPGTYTFLRLPDNKFVCRYELLNSREYNEFIAIPIKQNYRIGNRLGYFGASQHHGQLPGFTIYRIYLKEPDVDIDFYFHLQKQQNVMGQRFGKYPERIPPRPTQQEMERYLNDNFTPQHNLNRTPSLLTPPYSDIPDVNVRPLNFSAARPLNFSNITDIEPVRSDEMDDEPNIIINETPEEIRNQQVTPDQTMLFGTRRRNPFRNVTTRRSRSPLSRQHMGLSPITPNSLDEFTRDDIMDLETPPSTGSTASTELFEDSDQEFPRTP